MKVEQLKRGLFGYQKQSVYRCIAEMEEGYSARLLEQEERGKRNNTGRKSGIWRRRTVN